MAHVNIEIKAKCSAPERIRLVLKSKNANFKGTDHQIDTYFKVNSGRLKLREGRIENYLIFYDRVNMPGPKQANVILFKTGPKSELKSILTKALKILVVVDKSREIYFIRNVKFHIDTVKSLGTFIEIEAKGMGDASRERLMKQCKYYMHAFGIMKKDLVQVSYSDLLLRKTK